MKKLETLASGEMASLTESSLAEPNASAFVQEDVEIIDNATPSNSNDRKKMKIEKEVLESIPSPKVKNPSKILKQARLQKGYKLHHIVNALNISEEYIKAIESGHLGKLPTQSYTLGFIRSYAQYLGLDPREVIECYKETYNFEPKKQLNANFQSEASLSVMRDTVSSLFVSFQNSKTILGIVFIITAVFLGLRIFIPKKNMALPVIESSEKLTSSRALLESSFKKETPALAPSLRSITASPKKIEQANATPSAFSQSESKISDISTSEKSLLKLLQTAPVSTDK